LEPRLDPPVERHDAIGSGRLSGTLRLPIGDRHVDRENAVPVTVAQPEPVQLAGGAAVRSRHAAPDRERNAGVDRRPRPFRDGRADEDPAEPWIHAGGPEKCRRYAEDEMARLSGARG